MGSCHTRWRQREICCWLQCQDGQATGTDLQVQGATFEVLLSQVPWRAPLPRHLEALEEQVPSPLQRPDHPKTAASQGSASRPGQRAGEGARRAALRAGSLGSPGVLPCPGTHPPWDAHTCRPSLSHHPGVASHLWAFKDTGKPERKCPGQNVCCGCLCAHPGLQENQNSQAHWTMWSLEDH